MLNPTEAISRWIDAQPEGALIRSLDLERLVNRNQASRALARLAQRGRLMRVARGMYVALTASRFGPVPPPVDKVVQSLARIAGHTIVRHGAAAANALGLSTQVPVRQIYLTDGRARTLNFGKQVIEIRRAPRWMLELGDSTGGDVVRALEWLGPDLAKQAVAKLAGRIGQDDWGAVLEARAHLPTWMATDLLDQDEPFQDYVIVHELLHLRYANHGRMFKALMSAHVPGWRTIEQRQIGDADGASVERLSRKANGHAR